LSLEHKAHVKLGKPPRGHVSELAVTMDTGSLPMIELLKYNTCSDIRSSLGMNPLMMAAMAGKVGMVNTLLSVGKVQIDPKVRGTYEIRTMRHSSALQRALRIGGTECNECAVLLIAYGAHLGFDEDELDFYKREAVTDGLNLRDQVEKYDLQKTRFDIPSVSMSANSLLKAYAAGQTDVLRLCRVCAQLQGCLWQPVVLEGSRSV
jgi:hypothetical protein